MAEDEPSNPDSRPAHPGLDPAADAYAPTLWAAASEELLKRCAAEEWGQSSGPHPTRPMDDYAWQFVPDFPLAQLAGGGGDNGPDTWVRWLEQEREHSDRPANYYPDLKAWWADEARRGPRCREPIIAAIDEDGRAQVWGGYHRTGLSHELGLATVPVILGRLRVEAPRPAVLPPSTAEVIERPPGYRAHLKEGAPERGRG